MPSLVAQLLLPLILTSLTVCSPLDIVKRAVHVERVANLKPDYDYVIIGGGTSGLTVANRLTENPKSTLIPPLRGSSWNSC